MTLQQRPTLPAGSSCPFLYAKVQDQGLPRVEEGSTGRPHLQAEGGEYHHLPLAVLACRSLFTTSFRQRRQALQVSRYIFIRSDNTHHCRVRVLFYRRAAAFVECSPKKRVLLTSLFPSYRVPRHCHYTSPSLPCLCPLPPPARRICTGSILDYG